jgi:hypothetical protein
MIVVSDTSPVIYLAIIGELHILPAQFGNHNLNRNSMLLNRLGRLCKHFYYSKIALFTSPGNTFRESPTPSSAAGANAQFPRGAATARPSRA